ncbi:MAG: FtsX-like permease family protein [Bacteroidales bacterium]
MRTTIRFAWITLKHYRGYFLISIIGLILGLTSLLLVASYVYREKTTDRFYKEADGIFVPVLQTSTLSFPMKFTKDRDSSPAFDLIPEIDSHTALDVIRDGQITRDKHNTFSADIVIADSCFFQVFDYPLLAGDKTTVLQHPGSAVLSAALAKKIFDNGTDPLGKVIFIRGVPCTVTGISGHTPYNSSLEYDAIAIFPANTVEPTFNVASVIRLNDSKSAQQVQEKLNEFYRDTKFYCIGDNIKLVSFPGLYMDNSIIIPSVFTKKGNPGTLKLMIWVTLSILAIALFNYINIYSVLTLKRSRELSIKKIFGAGGKQLFGQIFLENLLIVSVATIIGLLFLELLKPIASRVLELRIVHIWCFDLLFLASILVLLPLLISTVSYVRVRFVMPVKALRQAGSAGKTSNMQTIIVGIQYVTAIGLVIISVYFARQLKVMLQLDCGYDRENIIVVDHYKPASQMSQYIGDQLESAPYILNWGFTYLFTAKDASAEMKFRSSPEADFVTVNGLMIDVSLQDIYNLEYIEGQKFTLSDNYYDGIILTESAKRSLEITDIHTARIEPELSFLGNRKIIGVVKDINTGHASKAQLPVVLIPQETSIEYGLPLVVKYQKDKESETLALLNEIVANTTGTEFAYHTVEDEISSIYKGDKQVSLLYRTLAILAVIISSAGVFGLSLFDVQRKYREIAIRKVYGASVKEIMSVLTKKYLVIIIVSFFIACPVAWLILNGYVKNFAVKAALSPWMFLFSGTVTVIISMATLWRHSYRAATQNPAEAIKTE